MAKTAYRVVVRKDGQTSDVEMTHPGRQPRIVSTFDSHAEAWEWLWEWINDQNNVAKFAARYERRQRNDR
jgi:hypothetical protein